MSELEIYAETIRAKYNEYMRVRKPWHKDAFCPEHFEKAAAMCLSLKALPIDFVTAQFHGLVNIEKFNPAFLHTKQAEKKYLEYSKSIVEPESPIDYEGSLQAQVMWLQDLIETGYKVEDALMLDDINFKSWFRVLITKEVDIRLMEKYKEKALEEIENDPDLFAFLNKRENLDIERIK